MMGKKEIDIIDVIKKNQEVSSKKIFEGVSSSISYATVKRILSKRIDENG